MTSRTLKQNVLISANLSSTSTFDRTLRLNFIPDQVIVRQVTYQPFRDKNDEKESDQGVYAVESSLLPRSCLCIVSSNLEYDGQDEKAALYPGRADKFDSTPQSVHNINNFTNNSVYNFQVLDPLGVATRPRGLIYVLLEFSRTEQIPQ